MSLPASTRWGPLGAQVALHGAAWLLAVQTLGLHAEAAPAGYVPWLVVASLVFGCGLSWLSPRAVPATLVVSVWALSVQLVLLPAGFSTAFRLLIMTPVLLQTVLSLPRWWGPVWALAELGLFMGGQGGRTAWGETVAGATDETLWGMGALGAVVIGFSWVVKSAFFHRDRAQAEVNHLKEGVQQIVEANVGFQELAAAVEQTSMRRERQRITREIHDIVGYTLTNQTMVLQAAAVLLDRDHDKLRELLASAEESARSGLQEVRQALHQLRVGAERPVPFLNRLNQLCRTFERATAVKVDLSGAQTPDDLPPAMELVLYRMIQEGLTNAFLHGKATRVSVGLALEGDDLTVHLADNGQGAEEVTEGIGLSGMRERLNAFRGSLEYRGGAHGFTVWARIPRSSLKELS